MAQDPNSDAPRSNHLSLRDLFSEDHLAKTIARIRSDRDTENLVTHPLKRVILSEYGAYLERLISRDVCAGTFAPERAYPCTVSKRSGGFRELVFPSLIDSIVGRHVIDELEPRINRDDDGRAFCGRAHANTKRAVGDYEKWFQVWRDYTSSIARAAAERGYAYVFETDVADFFPSIDRQRARSALEARTGVHTSLSGLLFQCLESWLVRYEYNTGSGIPIEPNDISRLVAHSYLKSVDESFPPIADREYLRFADDTVVFVKTKLDANTVKIEHYSALTRLGLSPNSGKTQIVSTAQYEKPRHVDENRMIDELQDRFDETEFSLLVARWHRRRRTAENWSRVAKRLYTTARRHQSRRLRSLSFDDLRECPDLADHVLHYLADFSITQPEMERLLDMWKQRDLHAEQLIGISRFLANARFAFSGASKALADFALFRIRKTDDRPGAPYARALLFLVLYKHGDRKQRSKVLSWGKRESMTDPQIRHHYLYMFTATGQLSDDAMNTMRPLSDSDLDFTLRICHDARKGSLKKRSRVLNCCVKNNGTETIVEARYLPLLDVILSCDSMRSENEVWIMNLLNPTVHGRQIKDTIVKRFLEQKLEAITR